MREKDERTRHEAQNGKEHGLFISHNMGFTSTLDIKAQISHTRYFKFEIEKHGVEVTLDILNLTSLQSTIAVYQQVLKNMYIAKVETRYASMMS